MVATPFDPTAVTTAGIAALRRGDANAAETFFQRVLDAGAGTAAVWFGLSMVHRLRGASARENAALDETLRLDAAHLPALIAKGDLFVGLGDRRAANSYYRACLNLAANLPSLPPEWQAELARIETASQGFAREYESHLNAALRGAGLGEPGTERFSHAIDLLLGKKRIYPQRPKYFFFPELAPIQFFERDRFSWAGALEQHYPAIREEAAALLAKGAGFAPYIERKANRAAAVGELPENPDWQAFFIVKDGVTVAENAARCPATVAALADVPLCRIDDRTPSVLFSLLKAGARIPPHHGFTNARLICHLPLIVPPDCGLRVGNETRGWREGEIVVFDDSIEHEAWNSSHEPRMVLIFDVWRPELSEKERGLVAAMLGAVDNFDGPRRSWTD
jgi:tetratricopeptide (TPR) repeat protein